MPDALQSILAEVGLAIAPLRAINTPERAAAFFKQLGYDIPVGAFGTSLSGLATRADALITAVRQLAQASSETDIATAIANIFTNMNAAVDAIQQLHGEIKAGGGGALPNIADLPRRLTDFLILDYFDHLRPDVHEGLLTLGLIEHVPNPPANQAMRLVNWDRFAPFLTQPSTIFESVYQWESGVDLDKVLGRLEGLMRAARLPGGLYPQTDSTRALLGNTTTNFKELRFPLLQKGVTPDSYAQFGITLSPAEAQGTKKKGFALLPFIMGAANFQFDVCDRGQLTFQSSADIKGVGVIVRPPFDAEGILNAAGDFNASIKIAEKPDKAQEIVLVGSAGGSRLSVEGLGISWFAKTTNGKLDLGAEAQIQTLRLVIGGGDGDGFIQQILSGLNVKAEAQLGFGMGLLSGFYITGGGKLAIELSVHIDLGPVAIEALQLSLEPADDKFKLGAGVNLNAKLGPLAASVEGIGLEADVQFKHGNLGPAQLDLSFLPPKGVGLSVDAGVVTGGGFLYIDTDRGEYAGALQLEIADFLSVAAIGLISTKMPDGSKGFSLLIILTADFGAGIQLSFGFTLLAVGGLLGLNRTMLFQPLMDGVRTNSIQSIMFPQDVIANAPRIISDLRAIFPPQEGTFLIGPMAKIGWGEPTLISLSLGVIIEIPPGDAAILGILRMALPADEMAILVLQVNFAGALEFDKQRFYFYASLFDSHVLFITISGSMGVLFAYGDDANFVVSVGGFHPQFNPPPLPFPAPQRISIDLINESFARIHADGYFAVTTNTVQFGTHSDFFFGFSACSVSGASGFDALIQFSPFHFTVEISTQFSVQGVWHWRLWSRHRCLALRPDSVARARHCLAVVLLLLHRHRHRLHLGRQSQHHAAAGRGHADSGGRSAEGLQLEDRSAGERQAAGRAAPTRSHRGRLRAASRRNPAGQPAQHSSRPEDRQSRQPGAERCQPVCILGFRSCADKDARPAGAIRAVAVPQFRRRHQAFAAGVRSAGQRHRTGGQRDAGHRPRPSPARCVTTSPWSTRKSEPVRNQFFAHSRAHVHQLPRRQQRRAVQALGEFPGSDAALDRIGRGLRRDVRGRAAIVQQGLSSRGGCVLEPGQGAGLHRQRDGGRSVA